MKNVYIITLSFSLLLGACYSQEEVSLVKASGQGANLEILKTGGDQAIFDACSDFRGAASIGVSIGECVLVLAGAAARESSWDVNKSCEVWDASNPHPTCGLTQSRFSDAGAVGLFCDPTGEDYKCNALTGLRNLFCFAEKGRTCLKQRGGTTLEHGMKKHLGDFNQGAFPTYKSDMTTVYGSRADLRSHFNQKFGVSFDGIRTFDQLLGHSANLPALHE